MAPKSENKKNRSPKKSVQRPAPQGLKAVSDVEQTPLNKFIRRQADQGRSVSPELGDVAGFKDAERRGDIKPVRAGESKPKASQGQVSKVRLRGDLAAQGVDTTPERSTKTPSKLSNVTRGGPVRTTRLGDPGAPTKRDAKILQRMTTASPEQTKALQRNLEKPPVTSKRGRLSSQADDVIRGLRRQGKLERRMSAGYDKSLSTTADDVLKQIRATNSKPEAVKQSEVSKKAAKFRQSVATPKVAEPRTGAPTAKPSSTKALPPARSNPTLVKTMTKVKQSLNNTPGQNLEFGKTKTGSFTYKPGTTTSTAPTTPPRTVAVADPTRRRASGNAGPSSKISSSPKPPATQIKADLGKRSTSVRSGSSTYKPSVKPKRVSSGAGQGAFYGVFKAMDAAEKEKQRGQSAERQRNAALASGTGSTLGAIAATKALGNMFGPRGRFIANIAGPLIGSELGSTAAGYVLGASKSDKEWMAKANRQVQTGTPARSATSKSGNRAIVRDAQNRERVGYLAYKDGKPVYKHGNDPSSLAYTSSNPLERIGRRTAGAEIPIVSDYLKGYYNRTDNETRKANVAAQRSRAGN